MQLRILTQGGARPAEAGLALPWAIPPRPRWGEGNRSRQQLPFPDRHGLAAEDDATVGGWVVYSQPS